MISPTIQSALNEQINAEFSSSYTYLAMSAYCERQHLQGAAKWLRLQSDEEHQHGMRLFDFLLAREAAPVLQPMDKPPADYESLLHVFEAALKQEKEVTGRIERLYQLAFEEQAFATLVELQWFITEQVGEERSTRDIVAKLQLVKDDPAAILDIDRELGARDAA